jgi:hypothetical protein
LESQALGCRKAWAFFASPINTSSTGIAFFPFAASTGDYLYLYFNSPLFKRLSAPDGDGSGQRPAMDDA